jgi:hypothetical protein
MEAPGVCQVLELNPDCKVSVTSMTETKSAGLAESDNQLVLRRRFAINGQEQ